MDTTFAFVVPLRHAADRHRVGSKAANLASLLNAAFHVPDGFVITTAAFNRFVNLHGFGPDTSPAAVQDAQLPSQIVTELHQVLNQLGGPVAMRSSGVAEDLAGASYAGQYETVLGVTDPIHAEWSLRHCWASAFDDRLVQYHQVRGNRGVPAVAVLVQRMVAAEVAGVAFSANPVTGERNEVVINAVGGLGDRLVAGEVDAEQWSVRAGQARQISGPRGTLVHAQALQVADLARRVQEHFGSPQDIEWAITGGEVHLLQARPITTLPSETVAARAHVPPGYWEREVSHMPRPATPFTGSFFHEVVTDGIRRAMEEFGLLLETLEFREIGGWGYARLVPLGGKDRLPPPAWLMPLLIRLVPSLRTRVRRSVEAMRSDNSGTMVERWYREWHPHLAARIASLRSVQLAALSDEELDVHLRAAMEVFVKGSRVHFLLHAAICFPLADLAFASHELLDWGELKTWRLLAGLSHKSTEPSHRLADLTRVIQARPDLRQILEEGGRQVRDRLTEAAPDVAARFTAYLEEFGTRALGYDAVDSTWAEEPELMIGLIADQLAQEFDPEGEGTRLAQGREEALAEAHEILAARSPTDQNRWNRALARAERAYPIREDNVFFTISGPIALLRYAALELGSRLAKRSQLSVSEDVFFLAFEEAIGALHDGGNRRELVAGRRAERAWIEAHPGPASYGEHPGAPPSLTNLPDEARFANQALIWYVDRIVETERSGQRQSGGEIRGIPASAGRYTGRVRVVMSEDEFGRLEGGDVLVCPFTSPVWSVLFPSIGALVTDTGGILSHAAIIAREYGIPAVVATGNATDVLQDGQMVTVDGTTGLVELEVPHSGLDNVPVAEHLLA